ncbi:hypothetical protein GHT06_006781 [Daphnia sinensis]|uniref:Retrotransposon gag domain-containing protein n=1 Tax=Daphnia sinensis TaxID=1820382 RepID=A0AAD5PM92_9CRUS|nr:hypothetical protein GHT06_006781 [Daphnia sinensis]
MEKWNITTRIAILHKQYTHPLQQELKRTRPAYSQASAIIAWKTTELESIPSKQQIHPLRQAIQRAYLGTCDHLSHFPLPPHFLDLLHKLTKLVQKTEFTEAQQLSRHEVNDLTVLLCAFVTSAFNEIRSILHFVEITGQFVNVAQSYITTLRKDASPKHTTRQGPLPHTATRNSNHSSERQTPERDQTILYKIQPTDQTAVRPERRHTPAVTFEAHNPIPHFPTTHGPVYYPTQEKQNPHTLWFNSDRADTLKQSDVYPSYPEEASYQTSEKSTLKEAWENPTNHALTNITRDEKESRDQEGEAYDLLQNILESSDTYAYEDIKKLFQENYHGSEDIDFYQNHFDEIQRKPKENILNYAYRLKTLYTRAYPSTNQETPEEKITQLRLLRQKFLQGLEPELQNIVKHKTVSTFEELVSITQKYAKRVQSDIIEKDKRIFVNAVASTQNETAILQAIEKQSDHINSIASCLKLTTTEPARQETNTSPDWGDKIERLTDVITNLGSLMHSSMRQTSEIRQRIRNNINHSANQSRFGTDQGNE